MHHLTHFKYEDTSFEGWRVAVQRSGILFCRYFSTLEYGGEDAAREEAIRLRDALLEALERTPDQPQEVFRLFAKEKPAELYPSGLCPPRPGKHENNQKQEHSFTVKCKPGLHARIRQLVTHLKLDYSSVIRLSLYALYTFILQKNNRDKTLRQLVSALEQANSNHAPTLSEFINQPPTEEEAEQHPL